VNCFVSLSVIRFIHLVQSLWEKWTFSRHWVIVVSRICTRFFIVIVFLATKVESVNNECQIFSFVGGLTTISTVSYCALNILLTERIKFYSFNFITAIKTSLAENQGHRKHLLKKVWMLRRKSPRLALFVREKIPLFPFTFIVSVCNGNYNRVKFSS